MEPRVPVLLDQLHAPARTRQHDCRRAAAGAAANDQYIRSPADRHRSSLSATGLYATIPQPLTGRKYLEPMSQTPAEAELATLIVNVLNLEDVDAGAILPEAPLFGGGLALDSIDALELSLEISKRYGVQLRSDDENNRQIFASLQALSAHIQANRPA
jgi:acyl carrier protein